MQRPISIIVILSIFLSGCASTQRHHPSFTEKISQVQTIAVMPPQVKIYQFQAGGTTEEMDVWNAQVRSVIASSLKEYLTAQDFSVRFVAEDYLRLQHQALWQDTEVLYEAMSLSAYQHTLTHQRFKHKIDNFSYSLGDEVRPIADGLGVDTFLFVYGYDYVSTKGRVALKVFNTAAAIALSAVSGAAFIMMPEYTPSFLSMGLVDGKTGELLWFKIIPPDKGQNFLRTESLTKIIQWMTQDLKKEINTSKSN